MNKAQLEAMLTRRGYTVTWDNSALQVKHLTGWLIIPAISIPARTYAQWVQSIDDELGAGAHHVLCSICFAPLLQGVGGDGTGEGSTHFYVYRDVSAGPLSEPIERCTRCGALLLMESVREVRDDDREG